MKRQVYFLSTLALATLVALVYVIFYFIKLKEDPPVIKQVVDYHVIDLTVTDLASYLRMEQFKRQNPSLFPQPTQALIETHEASESIIYSSGKPTFKNGHFIAWEDGADSTPIIITTTINDEVLDFKFVNRSSTTVDLLPYLPDEQYILYNIPQTELYVMSYNYNLFLLDIFNLSITPLLKDEINNFHINDLFSERIEYFIPEWASNPHISGDGSKVIFYSSRNALIDGNLNGQMWVKYLDEREEFPFLDMGVSIIGIDDADWVYYRQNDQVSRIHLMTKDVETIEDFSLSAALSYPYIIYQPDYQVLKQINVETKQIDDLTIDNIGSVHHISTFYNSPYIIIQNQPNRYESGGELIIYNLDNNQYKRMTSDNPNESLSARIQSENVFLVTSSTDSYTYQFEFSHIFQ